VVKLVYLAHGVVEDTGDDAAVAVAGRSGVALAQAEAADESLAGFVEDELEAHAFGIVHAADEAVVLLHFDVAGVVALGLRWHGMILTCGSSLGRWNDGMLERRRHAPKKSGDVVETPCEAKGGVAVKGILRFRVSFASRSTTSAQDDRAEKD
jgi:hypothetical protein